MNLELKDKIHRPFGTPMSMKMVVLSQKEIRNGVWHDEFREMGLLDKGQFMAMDEKPALIDVRDSLGNISRASAGFGYVPRYGVEDGLSEAIGWFMRGT